MGKNIKVVLSVGANKNAEENIKQAFGSLCKAGFEVQSSSIYHSYPINKRGDLIKGYATFANAVFMLSTCEPVEKIMSVTRDIEHMLGRIKSADKFSNIPIDIDLLLYQERVADICNWVMVDIASLKYDHIILPLCELLVCFDYLLSCDRYKNVFAISNIV